MTSSNLFTVLNNLILIFNTTKYLKFKQILFRLFYKIYKPKFKLYDYPIDSYKLDLYIDLIKEECIRVNSKGYIAKFLNKEKDFKKKINWNFQSFGKLWTYHLNYFDFLFDETINTEYKLELIYDYIENYKSSIDGKEPYTISLRGINWVKYLTLLNLNDTKIINHLYSQYLLLYKKIEYHLMGNHILENGFSLLFGAYFFCNKKFYNKGKKILISELDEQILKDGGHFERSPMYHLIILERLLESICLVENNRVFYDSEFVNFLSLKAGMMLSWINNISFSNKEIPLFNDSVRNNYPRFNVINKLAEKLNIQPSTLNLGDSGYRRIQNDRYEICLDVGDIGPDYQPGHAHADTFSFELYFKGKPIIVDTGTSIYEIGDVRDYERSTEAHNTVKYGNLNQSEVWGGFRVARRAKVINVKENVNSISATHNGYKKYGIFHERIFKFEPEAVLIEDFMKGKVVKKSKAYLHFHPDVNIEMNEEKKVCIEGVVIEFYGQGNVAITEYKYAEDFNSGKVAKCIEITFRENLKTLIRFDK